MASELFAGQYTSAFKGRGMEFAEVREYAAGDDIRSIDWNVSARFGRPFIKMFHEERELTVILIIDLSASNLFGTRQSLKRDLIAEVAGTLAFLAIKTNDKVGAIFFTSSVDKYIPPRKGSGHVWGLIKEIFSPEALSARTNIDAALSYLNKAQKKSCIVFLLSDFMDNGYEKTLKFASQRHDLTLVQVVDDAENRLPDIGIAAFEDPETGEIFHVNTSNGKIRKMWADDRLKREKAFRDICVKCGVGLIDLNTNASVIEPLTRFFLARGKRR